MTTIKEKCKVVLLFWGTYLLIGVGAYLSADFVKNVDMMLLSAVTSLLTIIAVVGISKRYQMATFNPRSLTVNNVLMSFGIYTLFSIGIDTGLRLLPNVSFTNQNLINEGVQSSQTIWAFLSIVILAPISEELLFRSLWIQNIFNRRMWIGLIISAFLFALAHLSQTPNEFLVYGGLGLMLGTVYIKTKSLECAILIHIFQNLVAFLSMLQ